jgi:hypothetical protein
VTKSSHPVDQLIRDLLTDQPAADDEEIAAIITRLMSAPFSEQVVTVPQRYRGLQYAGSSLGSRERSLRLHLIVRVVADGQWSDRTTEESYLSDLRTAVRDPAARLVLYRRRGGTIAAILTANQIPQERRGALALPLLYVIYAVDHSTIISGHQVSDLSTIGIPGDARWLK